MASPNTNNRLPRTSWRRPLICVATVSLMAIVAFLSIRAYKSIYRSFDTFSAVWLTHDMLVAHMHQTGHWPADWRALDHNFTSLNQGYGVPDLTWVRDRVDINFDLDAITLDSNNTLRDDVVWAIRMADGTENEEIWKANDRIRSLMFDLR